MKKFYVAYGSNLNLEQMAFRCPTAEIYGKGVIEDWELVFKTYATIEPKKGKYVPVGVWMIDEFCERRLDMYEGFPLHYRKEQIDVRMYNGEIVNAMVYLMNDAKIKAPTKKYFNTILQGYDEVGLDDRILFDALDTAIQHV